MNQEEYIIEILERVKGLETMLSDYRSVEDNSDEAHRICIETREEISKIIEKLDERELKEKETKQWTKRTLIAAVTSMVLILIGNIIFTLIKLKFNW